MAFPFSIPEPPSPQPQEHFLVFLLEKRSSEPKPEGGEVWLRFDKQAGDFRSNKGKKRTYIIPGIYNAALMS